MSSPAVPLAYLVSRYPAISHTFILREIQGLRRLGHTIRTASINSPDRPRAAMDEVEGQECDATYFVKGDGVTGALRALTGWLMRDPVRALSVLYEGGRLRGLRGLAYAVEAVMVAEWMRREGLAHLHVHFGNAGATVGMLVKALTGCHLSLTIHGPDEFDDVPGQFLARKMRAADVVVCISQFARGQLMRISAPEDWPKFRLCRLGVNPAQFDFVPPVNREGAPVALLCVGRLTPAKGQVLLVQACARLRDAGVPFRLTMVGEGPDRVRVEAEITRQGLGAQVRLTGALPQDGVRRELAAADVFVLPSLAEGIPVVLMEAMSSGVPCVSTPVNGIPELIEHGRTGLLATPGDVDSLTGQLQLLAADPALRRAMACAAREKVETDFDLERNVARLSAIFAAFPKAPR